MKKITIMVIWIVLSISTTSLAQTLNQSANWPNNAWTISGTYNTDPSAFESDPTTTSNFAFDDDDAGNSSDDAIAAESPVIDLTAAHTAGEVWITMTADYVYNYLASDELIMQYWDQDAGSWVNWGTAFSADTASAPTDNYCSGTYETFTSSVLNITSFTATQLSGFRYRISYDDDPAGADWNYGFCFQSPTITSATPPSCPDPNALNATTITDVSANLGWTEMGTASTWDIEWGAASFTQGTGTMITGTTTNPHNLGGLAASTNYEFYVRATCGGSGNSNWVGPFAFSTLATPPANNNLCNATALTIDVTPAGDAYTMVGATSEAGEGAGTCFDSGVNASVWFTFVAPASGEVQVSTDIAGGTLTDTEISVFEGPSDCNDVSTLGSELGCDQDGGTVVAYNSILNLTSLTPGSTYYVQVDRWGTASDGTFGIQVYDQLTLSVEDLILTKAFDYYPNPVTSTLNVSAKEPISKLTIVNVLGQEIKTVYPNTITYQLDFSSLEDGIYFIKATINNVEGTFRILKR